MKENNKKVKERRQFPRYNVTISISYIGPDDAASGKAESKNISTRGICFSTKQPMHIGHNVRIAFSFATETILSTGKVVWSEKSDPKLFDNGIEFISIDEEHLKIIEQYIKT